MSRRRAKKAIETGLPIDGYTRLREAGANQREIEKVSREISSSTLAFEGYARARESGGTRRQVKKVIRDGIDPVWYAKYREMGANNRQARDACGWEDTGLGEYQMGRQSGMSHRSIKKALRNGRRVRGS